MRMGDFYKNTIKLKNSMRKNTPDGTLIITLAPKSELSQFPTESSSELSSSPSSPRNGESLISSLLHKSL